MRRYIFRYQHGQSAPYKTIEADSHPHFYTQLAAWEKDSGFKHIKNTIKCIVSEEMFVPEPKVEEVREPFSTREEAIANRIGLVSREDCQPSDHMR